MNTYKVIDLFAGPGGLGEGFSSFNEHQRFQIAVSAEMDPAAHRTLMLRSWFRRAKRDGDASRIHRYYRFCNGQSAENPIDDHGDSLTQKVKDEALMVVLGTKEGNAQIDAAIKKSKLDDGNSIVIGGPPCQAYSLVGRSRNLGKVDYIPEEDKRHFLYKEYLRILAHNRPVLFIMENVKGLLSSKIDGNLIFKRILSDLQRPGVAVRGKTIDSTLRYQIFPVVAPSSLNGQDLFTTISPQFYTKATGSFIVKTEEFGIPQARHRVILLGIREGSGISLENYEPLHPTAQRVSVAEAISDLPRLRSRRSYDDSYQAWYNSVTTYMQTILLDREWKKNNMDLASALAEQLVGFRKLASIGEEKFPEPFWGKKSNPLKKWFFDQHIDNPLNHHSRSHIDGDLARYFFASVFAMHYGRSPKGAAEFNHPSLAPNHENWESGKFADRFHVQVHSKPSTTITSHISKDGHYYINPDPMQCRSLTVREAARLQTFPDNYYFQGNRTQQYHQVGNAVPPYLAYQIAGVASRLLD